MSEPVAPEQGPDNPGPGIAIQLAAVLACFLGGPIGALYLAAVLAPESDLAQTAAPLLAAAVFFFGFFAWLGGAFLSLLTRSGRRQARSGAPPKGTSGFVLCALVGGAVAGLVTAIGGPGFLGPLFATAGGFLVYGYLLHRLARGGYLPFPED